MTEQPTSSGASEREAAAQVAAGYFVDDDPFEHERETLRTAAGEAWWCLKGFAYHLLAPLRVVPLCRLGWHDWCRCCSPVNCTRCGASGHD